MEIANNSFNMGDFKLFIKIFEKFPKFFYNLGENPFHDSLLNLLLSAILINYENISYLFKQLDFESSWEMKTYDL